MRRYLLVIALMLTGCETNSTPVVATRVQNQLKPTTAALAPTAGLLTCGAEAAITFAQTQSDLALAAVAKVEALQRSTSDQVRVAKEGQTVFATAREVMKNYAVPECLATAKTYAVQFFDERVAAYAALAAGDRAGYDKRLNDGETARQNMLNAVTKILGP